MNAIGYKNLFARLKSGERTDESVRSFFIPEVNLGAGMSLIHAMVDRHIRMVVVTDGIPSHELKEMGFDYAKTLEQAVSLVHLRLPKAEVAAAFNAKLIISLAGGW